METNYQYPYDLKTHEDHGHEEKPDGYLSDEELKNLLVSKGIPFKRTDNLPRFAHNNSIPMMKIKRDGNYGSVPTVYKKPSPEKLESIYKLKSIKIKKVISDSSQKVLLVAKTQ